ncbi:MAG: tetratricopeptide repeat protein, partial [Gaiellaceae bacterium]
MARAAVKAKQAQQQRKGQPTKAAARRPSGRRKHRGGGNPNQQLFFSKLRRRAKFFYVILAVLFALTFAFLGVGTGTGSGLDQLFQNLNIFHSSGSSVSKAQAEIRKHPSDAKGFRDLATAFESKGDTSGAIAALEQYTALKTKDAKAWSELAGLQISNAADLTTQYRNAAANEQLAAPGVAFAPGGTFAQAIPESPIDKAVAGTLNTGVSDLAQRVGLAYQGAIQSYQEVTKLQPSNSDAQFQLAQAAQSSGNYTVA